MYKSKLPPTSLPGISEDPRMAYILLVATSSFKSLLQATLSFMSANLSFPKLPSHLPWSSLNPPSTGDTRPECLTNSIQILRGLQGTTTWKSRMRKWIPDDTDPKDKQSLHRGPPSVAKQCIILLSLG